MSDAQQGAELHEWAEHMLQHIEAAKLALAEPAGESPPFIIEGGGWYLVDAYTADMVFSEMPWKAGRMSKPDAERRADTLAELAGHPTSVRGWREETERFIERSVELMEAMGG